jgi:hypothetical protein
MCCDSKANSIGSFVSSIGSVLQCGLNWNWKAICLNPHYEGLKGAASSNRVKNDSFILKTYENWNFGADNSGLLVKPENIRSFVEFVKVMDILFLI